MRILPSHPLILLVDGSSLIKLLNITHRFLHDMATTVEISTTDHYSDGTATPPLTASFSNAEPAQPWKYPAVCLWGH